EMVLDDLVRLRLDPQRDERDFVHHALELGVVGLVLCGVAGIAAAPRAGPIGAAEESGRVVLDAQDIAAVQRLVSDERVFAFFELEAPKVRGRYESGLSRLRDEAVDVLRRLISAATGDGRIGGTLAASTALVELLRALQIVGFVLFPIRLADLD